VIKSNKNSKLKEYSY